MTYKSSDPKVLMVCTAAKGGMRAVVAGYERDGLFARWHVELMEPHGEGSLRSRLKLAASMYWRFVKKVLQGGVTLVHVHAAMRGSFWRKSVFAMTAKAAGIPVIFHLHGSEMKVFVEQQPVLSRRLISWILTRQTVVLVLSQSWKDYVSAIAPQARVEILPNYVVPPDLSLRTASTSAEVSALFLGLVGSRKGVFDLLPAMKQLAPNLPSVNLVIGGNGEVDRAQAMVDTLGLTSRVSLMGWVNGEAKLALLRSADFYVLPSHNEGLPVSLLEAMSWGLPLISTRVGGIPELVRDGVDGILVEPGDVPALAAAISRLAGDADLRFRMGQAARARVEAHFSREVVSPQLERLYESVTGCLPMRPPYP